MSDTNFDFILTNKPYNGKTYKIAFNIFNPFLGYNISILPNMIQRIEINNDIDSYYPSCKITFNDMSGQYTKKMNHYGQYVRLVIYPPQSTYDKQKKQHHFDLIFIINSHNVLNFDPKQIQYQIQCQSYISRLFEQHLNFATNKQNSMQSPYLLIKNILNNIGCQIKQQIPPCTREIHFISDQNKKVRDHIQYCLMMGASQDDPPTYLYYNLIDRQPVLINRNFVVKNCQYACNMAMVIPNTNGNDNLDNALIVYNIQTYSNNTTLKFYNLAALQNRWTYNTIKRQWTTEIFKPQKYKQLLSISQDNYNKQVKSIFAVQEYQQSGIRLYSQNFQYNVYARLHDIQVASNCMKFMVQGNILRDCGQIINLECKNNNYKNIYGGYWQTYSVTHIFQGDRYSNVIHAYRTYNYNLKQQ